MGGCDGCQKGGYYYYYYINIIIIIIIIIVLIIFFIIFFVFVFLFFVFVCFYLDSPASTKPAGLKIVKLDILLPNKISHCRGKKYVSGKVLLNATALPRWSDTESLW